MTNIRKVGLIRSFEMAVDGELKAGTFLLAAQTCGWQRDCESLEEPASGWLKYVKELVAGSTDRLLIELLTYAMWFCMCEGVWFSPAWLVAALLVNCPQFTVTRKFLSTAPIRMTRYCIKMALRRSDESNEKEHLLEPGLVKSCLIPVFVNGTPKLEPGCLKVGHLFKVKNERLNEIVKKCNLFKKCRVAFDEEGAMHWFAELENEYTASEETTTEKIDEIRWLLGSDYQHIAQGWTYSVTITDDDDFVWVHPQCVNGKVFRFKIPEMVAVTTLQRLKASVDEAEDRMRSETEYEWDEIFRASYPKRTLLDVNTKICSECEEESDNMQKHMRDKHDLRCLFGVNFVSGRLNVWEFTLNVSEVFLFGLCEACGFRHKHEAAALLYSGYKVVPILQRRGEGLLVSSMSKLFGRVGSKWQEFLYMMLNQMSSTKYVCDYLKGRVKLTGERWRSCHYDFLNWEKTLKNLGEKHAANIFRGSLAVLHMKDRGIYWRSIWNYLTYALHRCYTEVADFDVTVKAEPVPGAFALIEKLLSSGVNRVTSLMPPRGPECRCHYEDYGNDCRFCEEALIHSGGSEDTRDTDSGNSL